MSSKWDRRFLDLAASIAQWSKDPSTKVGAVIVDEQLRIVSTGYNGFPQGVVDSPERYEDRDTKYRMVLHGEVNAILFAKRDLAGCTLYVHPFMPCARCTAIVIQAGIKRVVFPPASEAILSRWADDLELSKMMFAEAGVEMVELQ